VETNRGAHPLPEKYLTVLLLTAQGFTAREIGEQLGLSPRWVQEMIESLKRRFYALSLPHLIAIVITLGIIDTRNFVPQLQENPDHD
jgi:DNA-binding CsgD family transcriptional regulator